MDPKYLHAKTWATFRNNLEKRIPDLRVAHNKWAADAVIQVVCAVKRAIRWGNQPCDQIRVVASRSKKSYVHSGVTPTTVASKEVKQCEEIPKMTQFSAVLNAGKELLVITCNERMLQEVTRKVGSRPTPEAKLRIGAKEK